MWIIKQPIPYPLINDIASLTFDPQRYFFLYQIAVFLASSAALAAPALRLS